MWHVTMRGRQGYTCLVLVSWDNAKTVVEASELAERMFPELKLVTAELVSSLTLNSY